MSLGRDKKDSRNYSIGNIGKWMVIGSELPIMVIAGIYIGYYLGDQFDPQYSTWFIILGAVLGFLVGTYNIFKIIKLWESREISKKIDKKEPPAPKPKPIESEVLPGEVQEKDSELSDDEKWERVIKLLKLQVNFEDDASSPENDAKFEE